MSWLKRILIGLGIVVVLLVALVLVAGNLAVDEGSVSQTMSMTVGGRTVTVGGHFTSMTQESFTDGVKVTVDGHEIVVSDGQLSIDGKAQDIAPGQDVEILLGKDGALEVKLVASADAAQ